MNCPACQHPDHDTIDSRPSGQMIRRRRKCRKCGERWSTYECNADFLDKLMEPRVEEDALRTKLEKFLAQMNKMLHPRKENARFRLPTE